jgi:hypothetical protein
MQVRRALFTYTKALLLLPSGPEGLLPLLLRCQADEQHQRDESAALAGDN